jgi:putative addiction module killer protein
MKIYKTTEFSLWFKKLKDMSFKKKLEMRFQNVVDGNFGDYKRLNEFLFELRFRSSYRVYCMTIDSGVIIIFAGKKDSQSKDIETANKIIKGLM